MLKQTSIQRFFYNLFQ